MIDPNGLAPLGERDLIHQRDKPIGVLLDNGAVSSCQSLAPMGQAHWGPLQQWWRLARSVIFSKLIVSSLPPPQTQSSCSF
ncbi:hypothetical protein Q31b_49450 [Novipirellula aureliae]|uniref:Uncharacterized protein n=1 Tax=Novipirellula aureliae TaxID=2527966 RepID=A0A5C6DH66_9BACT|nr:hypothetical protein Q31b_49450 [Novipirellula aureliae]